MGSCFAGTAFAQYQPSTAAEMTDFIGQVVQATEKKGEAVIHSECGIFTIRTNRQAMFSTRMLYPGHEYTVILLSDRMIPNFKFVLWRREGDNWVRVDSSNQNLVKAKNIQSTLLGDMETVQLQPQTSQEYAFQMVSISDKNETGHYGLIIQQRPASTTDGSTSGNGGQSNARTGDRFFKTRGYEWAYLKKDANSDRMLVDGEWQKSTDEGLFMANAGRSDFQQLQPTSLAAKYTLNSSKTQNGVVAYYLTHTSGIAATVEVDAARQKLTLWSKSSGRDYVIVYTVVESYDH